MKTNVLVLDKGFVRLVDYMGTDESIVEAARVSISGEGVRTAQDDRGLIRYLMRHRHTTPFEMCELKFHIKAPIFVVRQWVRHRTWSYNEMSGRYSELPSEWYVPELDRIQKQSTTNKQGSEDGGFDDGVQEQIRLDMNYDAKCMHTNYQYYLEDGVSRELARINLPVSTYTEFYAKVDLHNLLHFLSLRKHEHAQHEIQVYADAIGEMVEELFPITWEAFEDYRLEGMFLTKQDVEAIRFMMTDNRSANVEELFKTKREYSEFLEKIERLRI